MDMMASCSVYKQFVGRYPAHEWLSRHMASGGEDGSVALWDLDSMACERACTHMDGQVKTVSISHDSQYVAYAGEQDYLVMESLQGGEQGHLLKRLKCSAWCGSRQSGLP